MKTQILVLATLLVASAAQATTHNDCRITFRDCMKAKKPTEECLKARRECEGKIREELKAGMKPAIKKEKPETAEKQ